MSTPRRRVRLSVNDRPVEVWAGTSVAEAVSSVVPGLLADTIAGRVTVVDATGRPVDLDRDAASEDVLSVVPLRHPGTKPI